MHIFRPRSCGADRGHASGVKGHGIKAADLGGVALANLSALFTKVLPAARIPVKTPDDNMSGVT